MCLHVVLSSMYRGHVSACSAWLHVVLGCMYRGHVSACSAWTGDMCLHVVLVALGVLVTF